MNHSQYQQRYIHPNSQQHFYEIPTDDEMKPFKTSQILKKQKPIESLSNKQLIQYCHYQWKIWLENIQELKRCIENEKNDPAMMRYQEDKKPVLTQQHKNDPIPKFHHQQNQLNMPEQPFVYPQFYQPPYQQIMHARSMQYLRNNQPQSLPSYIPQNVQNVNRQSFPFPFNQQQMPMGQVNQSQGFTQAQMYPGRGTMMGNQIKK